MRSVTLDSAIANDAGGILEAKEATVRVGKIAGWQTGVSQFGRQVGQRRGID
ncbi:hypothetical protein ACFB49_29240 [Sphingomonas sp. DBB INV C78]